MSVLDDLATVLVTEGVAVLNTTLFLGAKAVLPVPPIGNSGYLTLRTTGGAGPDGTHNAVATGLPGYQRPGAQIIAHAAATPDAVALADAAYAALWAVRNQFINGVWWMKLVLLQELFELDDDDNDLAQVVFNVLGEKRPNAAMSGPYPPAGNYQPGAWLQSGWIQ